MGGLGRAAWEIYIDGRDELPSHMRPHDYEAGAKEAKLLNMRRREARPGRGARVPAHSSRLARHPKMPGMTTREKDAQARQAR